MLTRCDVRLLGACLILCLFAGCNSSNKPATALQFVSPSTGPLIEIGQFVNVMVNQPVTWALQSANGKEQACGTLSNVTSTFATYNAVPFSQAGSCFVSPPTSCPSFGTPTYQQVAVVATSTTNPTESAALSVTIETTPPCVATAPTYAACPPSGTVITSLVEQVFQVGAFQQVSINDGGSQNHTPFGVAPFTWSVMSGSLPNGLTLVPGTTDTSTAFIQGTPVSSGCSAVTLQVTDSTGATSSQPYALVVIPPALKVQVPSYPDFYVNSSNVGVPYPPTAIAVSGGLAPYAWTYQNTNSSSNLPGGICLDSLGSSLPTGCVSSSPPTSSNLGVLFGAPQAADIATELNNGGPYSVQLQINDNQQPYPAVAIPSLNMTVYPLQTACPSVPDIQPSAVNNGVAGDGSVPANAYLQGTFAFMMRGFDANGPVAIAGSVTTDGNGGITGGVEDITRAGGSQNVTVLPTGSSYSVGGTLRISTLGGPATVYNRGCMTLANSGGTTTTFAFSLGGCSNHYTENATITTNDNACGMAQNSSSQNVAAGTFTIGHVVEFDDNTGAGTRASGILRWQDTSSFSSGLSGLYAFGLAGGDAAGGRFAVAGSTQAGSGNFSSAAADIDDAGTLSSRLTGGTGTYNIASNGRGTGTLTLGSASLDLALYVVSANEAIAITTDALSATHPIASGEAILTAGGFGTGSLLNTHIFHIGGLAASGPDVSVGVLSFDGAGDVGGTIYENQAGTLGTTTVSAGYSVDSTTGRTVFSASQAGQTIGSHQFVAYILLPSASLTRTSCSQPASCVTGFLVGTDSTAQDGVLEFQTSAVSPPPPFSNPYVSGDYDFGTDESIDSLTNEIDGTLSSNTTNLINWTQDVSYASSGYCLQTGCLLLIPDETLSGSSLTVNSNGTGSFGAETVSVTNGSVVFYLDESPLNLHPTVMVAEQ